MTRYSYKALDNAGEPISGTIEAATQQDAQQLLFARGEIPLSVKTLRGNGRVKSSVSWQARHGRVKAEELILFTKQFGTMLRVGVPLLQLLRILEQQTENPRLRYIASDIANSVQGGSNLANAFRRHPAIFKPLFCSMVYAGESSGTLPEVLDRLVYIIEHEAKVRSDVRAALAYPGLVLGALAVAFIVMLVFVVPRFVSVYAQSDIVLPLPTRVCVGLSNLLQEAGWFLLVGVVLLVVGLRYALRTERGCFVRDYLLLRIPIVGKLQIKAAMSRFSSVFALLQASGVLALDAITILSDTIGNAAIARDFDNIREMLRSGQGLSNPLRTSRYFPPMVVNMVAIGEESGKLDEMLSEISKHYDAEVEYAMKKLSDSFGPILTVLLAIVVGFFALAIYMPMWKLGQMLH